MTPHKQLPSNPDLRIFRNQVQSLMNKQASEDDGPPFSVADARDAVALEYGFDDWDALRTQIEPSSTYTARTERHKSALPPDHEFFKAVGARDLDRVRELLDNDPSLANADARGVAAIRGDWGWGSPWGDPSEGETVRAIHFAAYTHADLLRLLIEYGADVDAYGCEGNHQWSPPLVLACWEGSRETVHLLLEAGANPNLPAIHGGSPLHSAINHWDEGKIDILLRYGARHDIFSAAVVGDLEEVKRQMNDGEYLINRRDIYRNRPPLEWAAFRRQEEVGEYLIEQGAAVTPQVLICLGMLDEIKNCVEDDPEFTNRRIGAEWSDPPLLWAVRSGQIEVMKYLLSVGADPNGRGSWDQMAIPLAIDLPEETSLEVVRALIDAGADVEVARRQTGRTHLGEFTTKGNLEVAGLLIRHGADVNRMNRRGQTPLQALIYPPTWEERYGDPLIGIEFLLSHGADINALSDDGKTALDIAIEKDNDAVAALLRERGGVTADDLT
ncbi:MAG: ankyrin repeat domain-containing protein [Chloroflexi bacterium]|nr:ankyrin repeat domain-containing protein [Chloroflexota bacterium]